MATHVFETDCQCVECKGSGLYVGLAERDGAAVVCYKCKGTGKAHIKIEWEDFEGRRELPGVARVVANNPGVVVGQDDATGLALTDFGGQSYEDWKAGKPFPPGSEMRKYVCPAWWYQTANYDLKPHWHECICGGSFYSCKHFDEMAECWARWDRERPSLAPQTKSEAA